MARTHGTLSCYKAGCHCTACRARKAVIGQEQKRRYRAAGQADPTVIPHGTVGGYTNYRCRCEPCVDAYRFSRRVGTALVEEDLVKHRARWTAREKAAVMAKLPTGAYVIPLTEAMIEFRRTKMAIQRFRRVEEARRARV